MRLFAGRQNASMRQFQGRKTRACVNSGFRYARHASIAHSACVIFGFGGAGACVYFAFGQAGMRPVSGSAETELASIPGPAHEGDLAAGRCSDGSVVSTEHGRRTPRGSPTGRRCRSEDRRSQPSPRFCVSGDAWFRRPPGDGAGLKTGVPYRGAIFPTGVPCRGAIFPTGGPGLRRHVPEWRSRPAAPSSRVAFPARGAIRWTGGPGGNIPPLWRFERPSFSWVEGCSWPRWPGS